MTLLHIQKQVGGLFKVGADYQGDSLCAFTVWAPLRERVDLRIVSPYEKAIAMQQSPGGYWRVVLDEVPPGTRYFYRLDNEHDWPDPASRFQPEGVHGPSQVVDHGSYEWNDGAWKGMLLSEMIIYELHVGTFTPEGTFDAIISRLDYLKDLGITAIEIMPVAQFPGERNWGYDGVFPYAVQNSYGGPDGLKRVVDACHARELALVLDVVYNHLGPEGNHANNFGPYTQDIYKTPWGQAINFDGPFSNGVRLFFIENALRWVEDYHVDALRLDAVHGIFDFSAKHFLRDLAEAVHERARILGRMVSVIAESDLNDVRVINPPEVGGYGSDSQWSDDFHHSLHTMITREQSGYYRDFGRIQDVVKAIREGFVYSGQYSPHRKRNHGNSSAGRPAYQFVVYSQNHDQTGNRVLGERLAVLASFEQLKLAAGVVLLSPYIPLLFMGEEYGEDVPFLYFVDHSDPALIEAVRNGRKQEFKEFDWDGAIPDPEGIETFQKSKLTWERRDRGNQAALRSFYKSLIEFRKTIPALTTLDKNNMHVCAYPETNVLSVRRWERYERGQVFWACNFDNGVRTITPSIPAGNWEILLDSTAPKWGGPGGLAPEQVRNGDKVALGPHSIVLYVRRDIS